MLLIAGAFVSSITLLSSISAGGGKFNILGWLIGLSVIGGYWAVIFVPGVALLAGVLGAAELYKVVTRGAAAAAGVSQYTSLILSALLQMAFTGTLMLAAAHKFRRPEEGVFSVRLSLLLAGLWLLTLLLGFARAPTDEFSADDWDRHTLLAGRAAFSIVAFLSIALFALQAAATQRLLADRAAAFRSTFASQRLADGVPLFCGVLAVLLGLLLAEVRSTEIPAYLPTFGRALWMPAFFAAVIALLLSCWTDYQALYAAAANGSRAWVALLATWGFLKLGPLLLDSALVAFAEEFDTLTWSGGLMSSVSPFGTLLEAAEPGSTLWIGLSVQFVLAIAATMLARHCRRNLSTG